MSELTAKYGKSATAWIKQLQGRNINNDALVSLNYRTGAVIAYVGSANYYGEATPAHQPAYDVIGQAFRQSGSAFKPITYADRLRARHAHAGDDADGRRGRDRRGLHAFRTRAARSAARSACATRSSTR